MCVRTQRSASAHIQASLLLLNGVTLSVFILFRNRRLRMAEPRSGRKHVSLPRPFPQPRNAMLLLLNGFKRDTYELRTLFACITLYTRV